MARKAFAVGLLLLVCLASTFAGEVAEPSPFYLTDNSVVRSQATGDPTKQNCFDAGNYGRLAILPDETTLLAAIDFVTDYDGVYTYTNDGRAQFGAFECRTAVALGLTSFCPVATGDCCDAGTENGKPGPVYWSDGTRVTVAQLEMLAPGINPFRPNQQRNLITNKGNDRTAWSHFDYKGICEACPEGSFCNGKISKKCNACDGIGQVEDTPCTANTDATCSTSDVVAVKVFTKDHLMWATDAYALSLKVENTGNVPIERFTVQYFIETENGEVPTLLDRTTVLDDHVPSLKTVCGTYFWVVEMYFEGPLAPGETTYDAPDQMHITYSGDGMAIDKLNDGSMLAQGSDVNVNDWINWKLNDKVAVFDKSGELIYGQVYPAVQTGTTSACEGEAVAPWGACDGTKACADGVKWEMGVQMPEDYVCIKQNAWYSQCRPQKDLDNGCQDIPYSQIPEYAWDCLELDSCGEKTVTWEPSYQTPGSCPALSVDAHGRSTSSLSASASSAASSSGESTYRTGVLLCVAGSGMMVAALAVLAVVVLRQRRAAPADAEQASIAFQAGLKSELSYPVPASASVPAGLRRRSSVGV